MENAVYNEIIYKRLYQKNGNDLLKVSALPVDVWKQFCSKNLEHVNTPISYQALTEEELEKYKLNKFYKSVITLPYLKEYQTLQNTVFELNFTTKQVLELLRKNLLILKDIHQHDIYHSDLHPGNIMINKKLDLEIIDFDSAIIDKYISPENILYDEDMSIEEQKSQMILQDKLDVLTSYFSYLSYGSFSNEQDVSIKALSLDCTHKKVLKDLLKAEDIKEDYYYIDFVESLIKEDYQSPVVYKRNTTFK